MAEGRVESVTVDFEAVCAGLGNYLAVELDADLNEGKTCFEFGEAAFFRVYKSPLDMVVSIVSSDGVVTTVSQDNSEVFAQNLSFVGTDLAQVSRVLSMLQSYVWYGNSLGILLKVGDLQVRSERSGVGVAYVKYLSKYDVYSITVNPSGDYKEWPVLVVVSEVL